MQKEHETDKTDKEEESPEVVKINEELAELRMKLLTCTKEEGERIKEEIQRLVDKKKDYY